MYLLKGLQSLWVQGNQADPCPQILGVAPFRSTLEVLDVNNWVNDNHSHTQQPSIEAKPQPIPNLLEVSSQLWATKSDAACERLL